MDFTFAIGEWVLARGCRAVQPDRYSGVNPVRYAIVSRWIESCPGGEQRHYKLRVIAPNGSMGANLFDVLEHEIEAAPPFDWSKYDEQAGKFK